MKDSRRSAPMQVSADMFKEMIERMSRGDAEPNDRRATPRVGIRAKVAIITEFASLEKPVDVEVKDLSMRGVGFEHSLPLRKGGSLVLLLPSQDGTALSILCTVRQCRHVGVNQYSIGAEFRQVLGAPSLKTLEAEAA
jgi:hypothetical protein